MSASFISEVDAPRDEVFAWHARPGALSRLLPPWAPVKAVEEAANLEDGRAVLSLAGLWHWSAQHRPDAYQPPHRFADELVHAPLGALHWRHTHLFNEAGARRTEVVDQVATNLPSSLLREMFAYRQRQLAGDLRAHAWGARLRGTPMTVAMTGSSGLVGRALSAFLTTGGHRVVRLVRRPARVAGERYWDPGAPSADLLQGVDAVVHLAGKPIFGRFSPAHEEGLRASRLGPTRRLAEAAGRARAGGGGPAVFVSASAVGFYGPDRGDEVLDEQSSPGGGFLAELVCGWEAATAPAAEAGLRVVNVRTGIVQSPRGGMLGLLYPVFFAGLGGRLGRGDQWTPWIGVDDLVDVYLRALVDAGLGGPVNAVAPGVVTHRDYVATLARVLGRPAVLNIPGPAVAAVLGRETAGQFVLAGQRARPSVLAQAGHSFRHPRLETALRHLLGRWEEGAGTGEPGARSAPERPALVL